MHFVIEGSRVSPVQPNPQTGCRKHAAGCRRSTALLLDVTRARTVPILRRVLTDAWQGPRLTPQLAFEQGSRMGGISLTRLSTFPCLSDGLPEYRIAENWFVQEPDRQCMWRGGSIPLAAIRLNIRVPRPEHSAGLQDSLKPNATASYRNNARASAGIRSTP